MSFFLNISFCVFGILAVAAILGTLRHYAPAIADLRRQLGAAPAERQIRFTLLEHALIRLRPNRGPLRHMGRRKPVKHRLHGTSPRRAAA